MLYSVYCTLYSVHCNAHNIYYLINLNFSLNILIKNSDKRPLRTEVRYFQNPNSDKRPLLIGVRLPVNSIYEKSGKQVFDRGSNPIFPQLHRNLVLGMEKWKKEYESRRKQGFDSKDVGTFPITHLNLDLGMEKM